MERCDFSSVISIIRKYISESREISQTDLLYELFAAFSEDSTNNDYVFDNGLVCRWFKGVAKISPQITRYYTDHRKRKCLSADIEETILPIMYDSDMAVQEIYDLVVFDTTISDGTKTKLTNGHPFSNSEEKADFLCAVLCFSMERNFIKRETGNKKLTSGKVLSPVVNDFLFGADAPKPCRYFCGRERELSELHFMLNEHSKVFLQGIPGIGKSELAKAYAKKFKKDYTNIIYINYSGNLKNDIVDLDFLEDFNANESEKERFRRHHRYLRSLKDDSLIIVDNFNTIAADEALLSVVLKYSCRILFTTRSRFDEYDTYTIGEMSDDDLLGLMGNLYSEAENHSAILNEIIHTVHNHTFAVELSARLLEIGILNPNQLLEKLQTEKAAMNDEDVIGVKKDGKSSKATYYNHIHTLFSLYELSELETNVMRNLTLAPHNGISAKLFALWMKLESMNTVNDLIERGFVQPLPGRIILLHPMIKEVAVDETKPSVVNCSTLLNSIHNICLHHGYDVMYYQQLFGMIDTIIELIENDDMESFLLFLEDVFPYMEKYEYEQLRQRVVEKMSLLLSDNTIGTVSDRALLLDYRAVLETKPSKAIQYENRAIAMITEINAGNAALVSNLYTNLGTFYQNSGNIELAVESMESAIQIAKDYNIVESHDNIVRINNYASLLVDSGQPYRALWVLNNLCNLIKSYYSDKSIDYAITQERMGRFYSYLGDKRKAYIHFKTAFDIYCIHFEAEPEKIEAKRQEMSKFLHIKRL